MYNGITNSTYIYIYTKELIISFFYKSQNIKLKIKLMYLCIQLIMAIYIGDSKLITCNLMILPLMNN